MAKIIERILSVLGILLLLAATIFLIIKYQGITGDIPIHFNTAGEADAYGSKYSLIFPLIMGWIIYISILILLQFPKIWNVPHGWAYGPIKMMVVVLNVFVAFIFSWLTIASIQGRGIGLFFTIISLGGTFGTIIVGCIASFMKRN